MLKILLISLFLIINSAYSQELEIELSQSSSDIKWETISNDFVKLIYPSYLSDRSIYIANIIEHYSHVVGQTYGILKPQQFPLIIRPEMAEPNGFVTLGPRRSEWFSSSTFSSYVGSSEWYQTLGIHEYRHVNQFDFFNRNTVKYFRYIMGDTGQQIAMFMGLQQWFMEGDAVWAETKYTDAGRGRSPLFIARLKALVLSGRIPPYDELINGTYHYPIANHYLFGYALVSHATKKFGDDFWQKVLNDITKFPHPWRLYTSFERISGQDFMEFYDETMQDLKKQWAEDIDPKQKKKDFRHSIYPFAVDGHVYSLNYNMDSYWTLKDGDKKIAEIPFVYELDQIHIQGDKAIYTQFLPHKRFGYKGSSDLFLIDLKSKEQKRITTGRRLYSPRISPSGMSIFATEFTDDQKWVLSEFDFSGKELKSIFFDDHIINEVFPVSNDEVVVLLEDMTGHKSIRRVEIETKKFNEILPPSRNNIFSLYIDKNKNLLFQAQSKGHMDIFKISDDGVVSKCTNSRISAGTPSSDGSTLYYSDTNSYGSQVKSVPLKDCSVIPKSELVDFNYLGDTPSDNLNKFPLFPFKDQKELYKANADKYKPKKYSELSKELFMPHTWGLLLGRGSAVGFQSDNLLRSMGIQFEIGKLSEENTSYTQLAFDLKKYYPIFRFHGAQRGREIKTFEAEQELQWDEKEAGVDMTLPYIYRNGLYSSTNTLSFGGRYLDTSNYKINNSNSGISGRQFLGSSAQLSVSIAKDLTARSIVSPWSAGYLARLDDATSQNRSSYSADRFYHKFTFTTPGLFKSHGFMGAIDQEKQTARNNSYRFIPFSISPTGYVFSRGYSYQNTKSYQKLSANYLLPLIDPDLILGSLYYLRRLKANFFFDSTWVESGDKDLTYNSYGSEFIFESKIARILPLDLGIRVLNKMDQNETVGEVFMNVGSSF